MNGFAEFFARNDWATLGLVFAGPFVQEDAAVIGAATAAMSGHTNPAHVFVAALLGLIASDTWKYWLGRAAQAHPWAAKYIADPRVAGARNKVLDRTGIALLVARFVPQRSLRAAPARPAERSHRQIDARSRERRELGVSAATGSAARKPARPSRCGQRGHGEDPAQLGGALARRRRA